MTVIGLTPVWNNEKSTLWISQAYFDAVIQSGAVPVLLPLSEAEAALETLLARIDAVIFTGGEDISPSLYGEKAMPYCGSISAARDAMELRLARLSLQRRKPILAICRGIQVINCALGGALYQDISAQIPSALEHRRSDIPCEPAHEVIVYPGTQLHACVGAGSIAVNSRHHQAIKTLGKGLRISAKAADGVIEGIELIDNAPMIGLQWHPESLYGTQPESRAVFSWLVRKARDHA